MDVGESSRWRAVCGILLSAREPVHSSRRDVLVSCWSVFGQPVSRCCSYPLSLLHSLPRSYFSSLSILRGVSSFLCAFVLCVLSFFFPGFLSFRLLFSFPFFCCFFLFSLFFGDTAFPAGGSFTLAIHNGLFIVIFPGQPTCTCISSRPCVETTYTLIQPDTRDPVPLSPPPPPLSPDRNSHVELTDHSSTEVFFCVSFFWGGGWITSLVCEPGLRADIEVVVLQLKTARCRSGARGPTAATSVATASSSASERCVSTPRTAASTVPPSSSAGPASASMRTSAPSSTWSTKPRNCKVSLCRIAALLSSTGSAL